MRFDITQLEIGTPVAVQNGYSYTSYDFGIVKSNKGRIAVVMDRDNKSRFFSLSSGYEIATGTDARGGSTRYRASLTSRKSAEEHIKNNKAQHARTAARNDLARRISECSKGVAMNSELAVTLRALADEVDAFEGKYGGTW